jgi:diaminopimelate epimerase
MLVNFTKMQGLGNDFVVIDLITQPVKLRTSQIKRIADRHLGIGCDQVILIEPPIRAIADFFYRIFNANGQEVEQCGNGARCAARFFFDAGFTNQRSLQADCLAGPMEFTIEDHDIVTANMGIPRFRETLTHTIKIEPSELSLHIVSMGNPHAVLQVADIESAPVKKVGPELSKHPFFPDGTNVGFMQILTPSHIRLRVYERGVGETFSCGTGACAAVVAGITLGLLDNTVKVDFLKGNMKISWQGKDTPVYMTGPAKSVFVGRFSI